MDLERCNSLELHCESQQVFPFSSLLETKSTSYCTEPSASTAKDSSGPPSSVSVIEAVCLIHQTFLAALFPPSTKRHCGKLAFRKVGCIIHHLRLLFPHSEEES